MRLLVLIFAYFVKSSCRGVGISKTSNISLDFGAKRTSSSRYPGVETNISSIHLTPYGRTSVGSVNQTLNVSSAVENFDYNVEVYNSSVDHNHVSTLVNSTKTVTTNVADSGIEKTTYLLNSNLTKSKNVKSELILPSKLPQSDSARFISEEKLHGISDYPMSRKAEHITNVKSQVSVSLEPPKGKQSLANLTANPVSHKTAGSRDSNPLVKTDSFVVIDNTTEIQQNVELLTESSLEPIDEEILVNTHFEREEEAPNSENATVFLQNSSNSTRVNEIKEEISGPSWLDVISSPFVKKTLKYFVTDFYPKKILETVAKRWKPSNSTKNGTQDQEINLSPSVMYPLVMEGVSILVNRLTDDGSNLNENESEAVVKGQIVHGVIDSLNKLLKPKGEENQNSPPEKFNHLADIVKHFESSGLSKDIVNSGTFNRLLPLVEKVPGDLQSTINGLMGIITSNTTDLHQISNATGINLTGILSQPGVLSAILQNRDKFSGLSSFQNGSALAEILTKPSVLRSILGNRSNFSDLGNLTHIMNHFLPKNGAGDGISPKNPLLRSDFASKVLAKSPIAHLGALDENIKRLITNSIEKAVSRVKINEKGEIQINEGMKKVLGKMIDSDKSSGQNRTSDSLMDVLKSAMASGSVRVEPSSPPVDGKPIVRRNVTHHSPLHRKFQEKYGKFYHKSSVEPLGNHNFVLIVLPIVITVYFI